jgi:thiamine biosynthesis lipoprotein
MPEVRLACYAMATRFELILLGEDAVYLRAAGEEALQEIVRIEGLLSIYRPTSELARINRTAAERAVYVLPEVFALLKAANRLSLLTAGAFDMTVGPLVRLWRLCGEANREPSEAELEAARAVVGMQLVELNEEASTVRFLHPGVSLDPGAIGKGYAVDVAMRRLRENGIACALLHGGSSTVYALGAPEGERGWRVALRDPNGHEQEVVAVAELKNAALSVSAPHGRWFEVDGRRYGHVIEPRIGRPIERVQLAATVTECAMEGDAISTALLVLGSAAPTCLQEPLAVRSALLIELQGAQRQIYLFGEDFSETRTDFPIVKKPVFS